MSLSLYEISMILISSIGVALAISQWRNGNQLKRAEILKEVVEKTRDDKEMVEVLYQIDYNVDWFPEYCKGNHETEYKFDRVFAFFDYLCYLKARGIITEKEFRPFRYKIKRMATNSGCSAYFSFLYDFSKRNKEPMSFSCLLEYMIKNRLIDEDYL